MFPKYQEIQEPLMGELLRRGGAARPSGKDTSGHTVYDTLALYFKLSDADLALRVFEENGAARSKWENMVRWARNDLRKRGLLDASQRGVWALSGRGKERIRKSQGELAGRGVFLPGIEIPPERLDELRRRAKEIGDLGEAIVLEHERSVLCAAGRSDLANAVVHVALVDVAAGYDIASFSVAGQPKLIEVKTTTGEAETFEITSNEWNTAEKHGSSYWVYIVCNAESKLPSIDKIQDPASLVRDGLLLLVPTAFRVVPSETS